MKITAMTIVTLTISASFLAFAVGAGASGLHSLPIDGDYASPRVIQQGHGPGGPVFIAGGLEYRFADITGYGSPDLIQLGHGPGGPSKASIDF